MEDNRLIQASGVGRVGSSQYYEPIAGFAFDKVVAELDFLNLPGQQPRQRSQAALECLGKVRQENSFGQRINQNIRGPKIPVIFYPTPRTQ